MLWSPTGPSVPAAPAGVATQFVPAGHEGNGGVARLINVGAGTATFTIGPSDVTNTKLIPLAAGQDIVVAYGIGDTHVSASAVDIVATPGTARP